METMHGQGIFGDAELTIRRDGEGVRIRNLANGRWLILTPEETVRQGLIWTMVHRLAYPRPMLSTEKAIRLGRMLKRFDVVALDRDGHPFLLAECKAPTVPMSPLVTEQAARYNAVLKAPYLLATNGLEMHCYHASPEGYRLVEGVPAYPAN